ncbi:NADP-dependent oxidoreductase [Catellatospora methionotrophica]|uniref:NADP-dependent oxidoreductase n=1 Tax=Catellatospora methionotrophica TaxID=121620 RepID=A0A8J3LJB4_9ACTN|nr:NADP-dependent oxidoreductase [Catellatospora methionotrophica]GIG13725.1 NADP-dependent oxidoreductase [Catellatospora methionotrophica]
MTVGREIHLASRPVGVPTPDNFRLVEVDVPEPAEGQVKVRNLVMSVDPYMRGRMNDVKSYVPPFALDAVLDGGAVGEVVASRSVDLKPGDLVLHGYGWREWAVDDARRFRKIEPVAPPSAFLGVLGMPGLTAYVGLLDIAAMKPGDTVFVSGAAGAVGSLVGQLARLKGAARVIGSAGSAAKVAHLTGDLGFDAAFNYRDGDVSGQLKQAAPDGIDVYFDNVGGDHLTAAIARAKPFARFALCGAISAYNEPVPGPDNMALLIGKRLTMRGFIVTDHNDRMADLIREVGAWYAAGEIKAEETVVEGLENAPEAFGGLLTGANTGKMVVRL